MAVLPRCIEIQTHDERAVLRLEEVERIDTDSYQCTLRVRSGWLACERLFFVDAYHLRGAIDALRTMMGGVPGSAVLGYIREEDRLEFEMDRLGHVFVSGRMVEHSDRPQSMEFAFPTDQTVLGPFVQALEALLAA